jgi:hypothetical protein
MIIISTTLNIIASCIVLHVPRNVEIKVPG